MNRRGRCWRGRIAALALPLCSCGSSAHGPIGEQRAQLGPSVAARIGADTISIESVKSVAHDTGVSAEVARDRLIHDALYAAGARDALAGAEVMSAERGVLARALLEQVRRDTASPPPSDAEIDELAKERWREFDRPVSVRTMHFVVRVKKPADDRAARALADRLAAAVRGIRTAEQFRSSVRTFPNSGLEVVIDDLPAVAADGRVTEDDAGETTFDLVFARAANAIDAVGEQSPIVKTKFGYHVILLVDRLPERRVPTEERRARLANDALVGRGEREYRRILAGLRRATPPDVSRAAADLTSRVNVQ